MAEQVIGKPITILIPRERQREEVTLLGSIRRGDRIENYETIRRRRDGSLVDISLTISPVKDAQGNVVGASKTARDITERKHELELVRRQADLLDQSHDAIFTWKIGGAIVYWNKGAERLYGYAAEEAIARSSHELLRTRCVVPMQEVERQIAREGSWYGELTHTTRDGRTVVVESRHVRVEYSGETYAHETNRDITESKRAEEQIQLLMREANHRVKNLLGLVQVVARQTAARNPEDFIGRFTARIQALAAHQSLLVRSEWGADVEDLVRAQLAHFADLVGSRVALDGPKLHMNATAAQAVGLAIHELSTNAGKYGSRSTDAGRVDVNWQIDGDLFKMSWIERNGPPVRASDRRGFGNTVIEAMTKRAVDCEVQLEYDPEGVTWHLTCPAENSLER